MSAHGAAPGAAGAQAPGRTLPNGIAADGSASPAPAASAISRVSSAWLLARSLTRPPAPRQDTAARILNVTAEVYHSDPCDVPTLSASIAHLLVAESPRHAYVAHPRLGGGISIGTRKNPQLAGEILHRLILGKGREIVAIAANDFRTARAQELRDTAFADGRLPILTGELEETAAFAGRVRDRCAALGFPFDGESEVAIEWSEPLADGNVRCRCMMDHVDLEHGRVYDLKRVADANPRRLERTIVENGLDLQAHAYRRALEALRPELVGRVEFTFLFVEADAPHEIVPAVLDGRLREIGELRWQRALRTWRECLTANRWPGYTDGRPALLEAQPWDVAREIGSVDL